MESLQSHSFANLAIPIFEQSQISADMRDATEMADLRLDKDLVDLRKLGIKGQNYYATSDGTNLPYAQKIQGSIDALVVREKVADRLLLAERDLEPFGLCLWVFDGYRPLETQHGLWNFFYRKFTRENPEWSTEKLESKTRTFVSDPRDFDPTKPSTCPPHATGDSVDLTLADRKNLCLIDMGAAFDDMTEKSRTDYFEVCWRRGLIAASDPRLLARRILYSVMQAHGLSNYAQEYWHFDFTDGAVP